MTIFKTIERINLLHKLISDKRTGDPSTLSKRLGVSRTTLYSILEDLKSYGAPIAYSRVFNSFYYTKGFELNIRFTIQVIDDDLELKKINAGSNIFCFRSFFWTER